MADNSIITGQFVRIEQTPASLGERAIAYFIDMVVVVLYGVSLFTLFSFLPSNLPDSTWLFVFLLVLPALGYPFLCETFNEGQTPGKRIMKIRVVKVDGSTPSVGNYLLRWLLRPIDGPVFSYAGALVILLTERHQRLGDLAAGTMVVKLNSYKKIAISLDEYDYLSHNYTPRYRQAENLSLEQANIISRTLASNEHDKDRRIALLYDKVRETLGIDDSTEDKASFLETLLRDYQYFAMEMV